MIANVACLMLQFFMVDFSDLIFDDQNSLLRETLNQVIDKGRLARSQKTGDQMDGYS